MRESEIEKHFTKSSRQRGALVRKLRWIGRNGAPDRVVIHKGFVFFVELKRPGGSTRISQTLEHRRLEHHGANVAVLSTIEEVNIWIEKNLGPESTRA